MFESEREIAHKVTGFKLNGFYIMEYFGFLDLDVVKAEDFDEVCGEKGEENYLNQYTAGSTTRRFKLTFTVKKNRNTFSEIIIRLEELLDMITHFVIIN